MTPKQQIQSAKLTANALEGIDASILEASVKTEHLLENIKPEDHPQPVAALEALQWHLAAARSLGSYVGKLNNDYGCEGEEGLAQQLADEAAAEATQSADPADDSLPSHAEIEAILERLGVRSGTVVVVRVSEDDEPTSSSTTIH